MTARLNSNWIVGFTDAEACFYVGVLRSPSKKFGVRIQPDFNITQHVQDIQLLHGLKKYFGCGTISINHGNIYRWRVRNRNHLLENVIPFFEKHPLKGKRQLEFQRFSEICRLMKKKVHFTEDGFHLVVNKAKSLRIKPNPCSESDLIQIYNSPKSLSQNRQNPQFHSNWIVGFTEGEGCFHVGVIREQSRKFGVKIQPCFIVSQHRQDIHLLHGLKKYFGCGNVFINNKNVGDWRVSRLDDLLENVIPFFEKHLLKGKRRVEFQRFREICLLMKRKVHLTKDGLDLLAMKAKALRIKPTKNALVLEFDSKT